MKDKKSIYALIFAFCILAFAVSAKASETDGTIVSGGNAGYAWSDQAGWVNFGTTNGNLHITDSGITGYVWNSNYGWINMAPTIGGVAVTANGALSGYAWGSGLGWIKFSGASINSSGKFIGQATSAAIGTLTFDCDNCSVTTDYRPQNFRTTPSLVPLATVLGGGGGGGGGIPSVSGPGGQAVPAHIDAFNVPMKLFLAQSGTFTQNLANQKSVILDVPSNVYSDDITFNISEKTISSTISPTVSVIGNALFNVTAWDKANNPVHSFLKPIKITFTIPKLLRGRADLGVYFFDEATNIWTKIPDAIFSGDTISFYVSHLTLFAIFSSPVGEAGVTELPSTIESPFPFPLPTEPGFPTSQKETPTSQVIPAPPAGGSKKAPPLFDIKVGPGPAGSKKSRAYIIVAIAAIVAAGIVIYILRRRKNAQMDK